MLKEFKEFAMKGNVLDMAIGVIMGGAFGKIVDSLVSEVIMPPIGLLLGGLNFKDLFYNLKPGATYTSLDAAQKAGAPVIAWGSWLMTVINFVIIAFVMFMMVKSMNAARKAEPAPPPPPAVPPPTEVLLTQIRDLLKARG
jgi:large conductance mechanosensitive channel